MVEINQLRLGLAKSRVGGFVHSWGAAWRGLKIGWNEVYPDHGVRD
jgi:hypothetical protein